MYTLFAHHTTVHTSSVSSMALYALAVVLTGVAVLGYVTQRRDK